MIRNICFLVNIILQCGQHISMAMMMKKVDPRMKSYLSIFFLNKTNKSLVIKTYFNAFKNSFFMHKTKDNK